MYQQEATLHQNSISYENVNKNNNRLSLPAGTIILYSRIYCFPILTDTGDKQGSTTDGEYSIVVVDVDYFANCLIDESISY